MAVPRVFLSSTFFDLKQVRNNIGDFIKGLGYEPVMHEKSSVAYTYTTPLENDETFAKINKNPPLNVGLFFMKKTTTRTKFHFRKVSFSEATHEC